MCVWPNTQILKVMLCVCFAIHKEPTNKPAIYRKYSEYRYSNQKHLFFLHSFSYSEVR